MATKILYMPPQILFFMLLAFITSSSAASEVGKQLDPKTRAWIQYVSAVHEGMYFIGHGPKEGSPTVGVDPEEFEGRSRAIQVAKAKLVGLGQLQQKKITVKSLSALVEHPLDQFWDEASKVFHEDVIKDMIGLGFDLEVKVRRAELSSNEEFDMQAPLVLNVCLPSSLMKKLEKGIVPLVVEGK